MMIVSRKMTILIIIECILIRKSRTDRCKPLLESDISSIIEVRRYFDEPIKELRKHLDACDNCPNNHYMTRSVHVEEIDQVHEYDYCVKKDENGVEKYFKYSEIVCERIGHPLCYL